MVEIQKVQKASPNKRNKVFEGSAAEAVALTIFNVLNVKFDKEAKDIHVKKTKSVKNVSDGDAKCCFQKSNI